MKVGVWESREDVTVGGEALEEVEDFCYLGSVIAGNGSCDKEIRIRLGKANATFGRLNSIWKNKGLSLLTETRLYRGLVLTTVMYGSETWPMTKTNLKKLEAGHHRWQRRILGVTWRDKVRNEDIRKRTSMEKLEDMLKTTRLRWLGHIYRSDNESFSKQALEWTVGHRQDGKENVEGRERPGETRSHRIW